MSVGLYIHVPFCLSRCHFCSFYLHVSRPDKVRSYTNAVAEEILLHAKLNTLRGRALDTIYFGGGTPTTLAPADLRNLLHLVSDCLGTCLAPEVTVEAHPDTMTPGGLRTLVEAGVTRLSFGVQSVDDQELVAIGRETPSHIPAATVAMARSVGFRNVNMDLMYGLPGQTVESWTTTLDHTIALQPTHISCYALTVEARTRYERNLRRGSQSPPDPDIQNAMEETASQRLTDAGFQRYEISNYCRPGYACRHNLLYWEGQDYLGLGPSAQSFLGGCRFGNVEDLDAYVRSIGAGQIPAVEREVLTGEQRRREAVVFGLRLSDGIARAIAEQTLDPSWTRTLQRLMSEELLEEFASRIRLTDRGRRYADTIAVELL